MDRSQPSGVAEKLNPGVHHPTTHRHRSDPVAARPRFRSPERAAPCPEQPLADLVAAFKLHSGSRVSPRRANAAATASRAPGARTQAVRRRTSPGGTGAPKRPLPRGATDPRKNPIQPRTRVPKAWLYLSPGRAHTNTP